jgi:hypothetical protein
LSKCPPALPISEFPRERASSICKSRFVRVPSNNRRPGLALIDRHFQQLISARGFWLYAEHNPDGLEPSDPILTNANASSGEQAAAHLAATKAIRR